MGELLHLLREGTAAGGPSEGPGNERLRETIQKADRTHQWDFVLRYDRQFRQAAAGDRSRSWAKLDSALFMQELAGPQAAYLAGVRAPVGGFDSASRKRGREAETREALRGRNYRVSVISLTSRIGCASLVRDAGSGMHARSVVEPVVTARSYSGGEGTPGEDQELARAKPCRESQWY